MARTVSFFQGARRRLTKKEEDSYEDFYERAFTDLDLEKISEEGGTAEFTLFRQSSKSNIGNRDLWNAMFNRPVKRNGQLRKTDTLGQAIFVRFQEDQQITVISDRIRFKKGITPFEFDGKLRKGGQFIPKGYTSRRR